MQRPKIQRQYNTNTETCFQRAIKYTSVDVYTHLGPLLLVWRLNKLQSKKVKK